MVDQNIGAFIPLKLQTLLEEYPTIVPKEIPLRLPLMKDIQHAINFTLGSIILNKLTYQMSLQKHVAVYH